MLATFSTKNSLPFSLSLCEGKAIHEDEMADNPDKQQQNLHDSFFKQIFKHKKYLKELLLAILSPEAIAYIDWDRLEIQDGELIKRGGRQIRADLIATVNLQGNASGTSIVLTFIFEHKSYRDPDVILQIMEYSIELMRKQASCPKDKRLIIPIVLLCCKDRDFKPPTDYLHWAFGDEEIPKGVKAFKPMLPKLFGEVVDMRELSGVEMWTEANSIAIIKYSMSEVWNADDDTVAYILDKARDLNPDDAKYLLMVLSDYYAQADNQVEYSDFERVERERWPKLKEEDRLMQTIYFGPERYRREGIAQGIEQGIEQGRKKIRDSALRMLALGMTDKQIKDILQLSVKELANIKRHSRKQKG